MPDHDAPCGASPGGIAALPDMCLKSRGLLGLSVMCQKSSGLEGLPTLPQTSTVTGLPALPQTAGITSSTDKHKGSRVTLGCKMYASVDEVRALKVCSSVLR